MRSMMIHPAHQILSGDQVKEDEVCGARGICGGEVCMGFYWRCLRLTDHLEDKHRWEDNIRMDIKGIGW
jgi:hypothetical protein